MKRKGVFMKVIGVILLVVGAIGMLLASVMFGDIGLAAMIASITAILSGVGFIKCDKVLLSISKVKNKEQEGV